MAPADPVALADHTQRIECLRVELDRERHLGDRDRLACPA
jgi:hypothetical protein